MLTHYHAINFFNSMLFYSFFSYFILFYHRIYYFSISFLIFYYFILLFFFLLFFFPCFYQIVEAVVNGVNVVIWFAVNLAVDKVTGLPIVQGTVYCVLLR